jgi:lysophospholipase L1-like esterase
MTLMQCDSTRYDDSLGTWDEVDAMRRAKNEAIKEIADYYGIPVIDLWNKSGITPYNAKSHYKDWLHPNQYGYRRLAECVYRHLK